MIGKVPKAGRGFKGVVSYLLHGEKGRKKDPARVAWTEVRNLAATNPELVPGLMRATAGFNRRCQAPVYHFVISWRNDEEPTDDVMRQVADTTCRDLELDDHQRLYVAHADTMHRHVHVVVNRIHPHTHKAWNRRQDWARIERSLADQAWDLGFEFVPGRHNELDFDGGERSPRDGAFQRAKRLGVDVIPSWTPSRIAEERDGLAALFDKAQSWEQLDGDLGQRGMMLIRKGQGAVLADQDGTLKVSSLRKGFGLKRLEDRFGERRAAYLSRREAEAPDARAAAMADLAGAAEDLDFAVALYRMGLVGRRELERHMKARDQAQDDADQTLSFRDRVARELAKALREPRPFRKPQKRRREKERNDDRDL